MNSDSFIFAANNSPFLIFNLFADYFEQYGDGSAWTQEILYLLGLLGVSEQATRSTLLRMKRKGWLDVERNGRRSRYRLSPIGREITQQGDRRIFEPQATNWNESWQLVVYSLPESKRPLRTELRKKLVWFGFGNLTSGTWITPHNRQKEMADVIAQLDIQEYVSVFQAQSVGGMSNREIVAKCWDLVTLGKEYELFNAYWQPRFEAIELDWLGSAEKCFMERFQLTFDFQPFPRRDPNLPVALLPSVWSGHEARTIFTQYRQFLSEGLSEFIIDLDRVRVETAVSYPKNIP